MEKKRKEREFREWIEAEAAAADRRQRRRLDLLQWIETEANAIDVEPPLESGLWIFGTPDDID